MAVKKDLLPLDRPQLVCTSIRTYNYALQNQSTAKLTQNMLVTVCIYLYIIFFSFNYSKVES